MVSLNKIITSSKESVKGISSNSITKGADEIKTYDTSDLLSKTSKKTNKRLRPLQLQIYLKTFELRKEKKTLL